MATGVAYIYIYSNDGTQVLHEYMTGADLLTVTDQGCIDNASSEWTYAGTNTFLGFATSPNATEPTYAIGSSIALILNGGSQTFYIVEREAKSSGVTVEYNGSVVATVESGNKATLPIKDLKMKSDLVVTVPEAADSPLPIEVSTEAEMTALLTSGEVGGVYKYTGTTGTYENGALYVLEEEAVSTKTLTVTNNGSYSPYVDYWIDKSNTETADGNTYLNIEGEVTEFTGISSYIILGCETAFDSISDAVGCTYESISSSVLKITLTADTASIIVEVND